MHKQSCFQVTDPTTSLPHIGTGIFRTGSSGGGERGGGGAELDTGLGSVAQGISSRPVSASRSGGFPASHTESLCWWLFLISLSPPVDSGSVTGGKKYSMMSFVVPSPWQVLITCVMDHSINKMSPQVKMLVLTCSPRERKEVPPGALPSTSGG